MARKPGWFKNFSPIRQLLAACPEPVLDRRAIQSIFSLKPRQAAILLRRMGAREAAAGLVIQKEEALSWLDAVGAAEGRVILRESSRRAALLERLAELRAAGEPPLRAARHRTSRPAALPGGVTLAASGRLEIRFRSPEDLLAALLGIADLASRDPAAFRQALTPEEPPAAQEEPPGESLP